jgi:hypothetical protein
MATASERRLREIAALRDVIEALRRGKLSKDRREECADELEIMMARKMRVQAQAENIGAAK